ncbi:MAG: AMP-binding protein, partial [Specibacter sp.]
MPFINQLRHWARARPGHTAVVVGPDRLSYAQLRDAAASLHGHATAGSLTVIDTPTSAALAVQFCAAVAGSGVAAVLDASWPDVLKADIAAKAGEWAAARESAPVSDGGFADGPPESTFMLGLSSGTSGLPKAFTRSRESWRWSFEHSVPHFALSPDDVVLAPGPLAASMNLYALGESLYAGSTFVALPSFSPDAALASIKNDAVTRLVLVPSVLGLLAKRGLDTGQGAGAVTTIICAGSSLPPAIAELARRWAPQAR